MRRITTLASVSLLALSMSCAAMGGDKEKGEGKEENEVKVALDQVPAAVQATLKEEAKGVAITEVDKETDDGKTVYETDVVIKGKNYEIKVAEDGTLISKKLENDDDEKGEKDEKGGKEDKEDKD